MKTLVCVLLFSAAMWAADVSFEGRWSGTDVMTGSNGDSRENGRLKGDGAGSPNEQPLKVKLDLTKGS